MSEVEISLEEAIDRLQAIQDRGAPRHRSLAIRRFNPGAAAAFQTVAVRAIDAGFDWEAGSVVLTPAKPLTELSAEQVAAIQASVRAGNSWHAYERFKRLNDRIQEL